MNKNKIIILVAVAVVVILVVVFWNARSKKTVQQLPAPAAGTQSNTPQGPVTREEAPQNVVVPEAGKSNQNLPKDVAIPESVAPLNPQSSAKNRTFSVRVENDKFTPGNLIVNKNDNLDISFTAVDKNYDFTQPDFGFKLPLPKGKSTHVIFQATAEGKFSFYCSSCGGPREGPVGYVIAAAK